MNTMKYRAFVEAVRCGSLTRAAEAMNYTQSGVSHMIAALEQEFGFPLLFRSKGGTAPTEDGKRLYELCVRIVDAEDELHHTVGMINGVMTGKLRIGAYFSVLTRWMPSVVREFSQRYPQVELQLFEGEIEEQLAMLDSGRIDLGLFSLPIPEEYAHIPLCQDEIVIILPKGHALTQKEQLTRQDLLQYQNSFILPHESADEDFRLLFGADAQQIQSRYSVRSDSTIIALVEMGLGISVSPRLLLSGPGGPDVEVRSLAPRCFRTLGLVIPKFMAKLSVVKCFCDVVCGLYQDKDMMAD